MPIKINKEQIAKHMLKPIFNGDECRVRCPYYFRNLNPPYYPSCHLFNSFDNYGWNDCILEYKYSDNNSIVKRHKFCMECFEEVKNEN
jgi:hypothetical protein